MFDTAALVDECLAANAESDPRGAVREVLLRTLADADAVAACLGKQEAGLSVVFHSPDLTVLNVIWAPGMTLFPHDHQMWATIGVYGGREENTFYRRGTGRIVVGGGRVVATGDVVSLGAEAIHAVHNPQRSFTGAIHVYGGDFINTPRSQWDPDTLLEQPYNLDHVRNQFAAANAEWSAQLGHDLDESAF